MATPYDSLLQDIKNLSFDKLPIGQQNAIVGKRLRPAEWKNNQTKLNARNMNEFESDIRFRIKESIQIGNEYYGDIFTKIINQTAGWKYNFPNSTGSVYGEIFNDYSNNQATKKHSSAFGTGTKVTTTENEFAIGQYNKSISNAIFEIGNGTSDSNRKNALVVYKNGQVQMFPNAGIEYGDNDIVPLSVINTTITNKLQPLSNKIDTLTVTTTTLSSKVSTLESNVDTLSGKVSTSEINVATLSGKVLTIDTKVVNLTNRVSTLESSASGGSSPWQFF